MIKKVAFVIPSHYNFESTYYCLTETVHSLSHTPKELYDIYIVDSSTSQKKGFLELSKKMSHPCVHFISVNYNYAVNSKKNIFYREHLNDYSVFIEIENDMFIVARNHQWLVNLLNCIDYFESDETLKEMREAPINVVWSALYDGTDGSQANPCGFRIISKRFKKIIGEYPSELTGEYVNNIEEMLLFPRDTRDKFKNNNFTLFTAIRLIDIEYDLYSRSTNFINSIKISLKGFDYLRKGLSVEKKKEISDAIHEAKMREQEYGPYNHMCLRRTGMPREEVASILKANITLHRGVNIDLYKKIELSLFVFKKDYFTLRKKYELNTDEMLEDGSLFICDDIYFFFLKDTSDKHISDNLIQEIKVIMKAMVQDKKINVLIHDGSEGKNEKQR